MVSSFKRGVKKKMGGGGGLRELVPFKKKGGKEGF